MNQSAIAELRAFCRPLLGDVNSANDRGFEAIIRKLEGAQPAAPVEPFDVLSTIDPDYADSFERDHREMEAEINSDILKPAAPVERAAFVEAGEDIISTARFLIERLNEFEQEIGSGNEEREWAGHVHPAMLRLKSALDAPPRSSADTDLVTKLYTTFDRIEVSCDWRLSSEERQCIAEAANTIGAQAMRLEACDVEIAKIRSAVPQQSADTTSADKCPYDIDDGSNGCMLEHIEIGPCLCANPVRAQPQAAPVNAAMAQFVQWAMREGAWSGCDLEGSEIQEEAERLGLLVRTKYDPEIHGESEFDVEAGDDWYVLAPEITSALSRPDGA